MRITSLPTPQVIVDVPRARANIDRMQHAADASRVRLRPHAKTHKIPQVARWQIDRGAVGICCAKVGEAEVFAAHGIEDIRLPYPVHPVNAPRIIALMDRARVSLIVDNLDVAGGWSEAMTAAGRELPVLVKVDVGFHRCGIDPASEDSGQTVASVASMPGLRFAGLLSHAGHGYGASSERELRHVAEKEIELLNDVAQASGVAIPEISVGATPTARFSLEVADRGITELRPGNYVYFDRTQVGLGAATRAECALTVLARVVSRPAPDRVILDCGSKTLSSDGARGFATSGGYGSVLADLESDEEDSTLVIERLSEEHATVKASAACRLRPGDLVRVLPNHSCVVSNLVEYVQFANGLDLLETVRVEARGKIN